MNKFIYSLGLIALGLLVGQTIRYLVNKEIVKDSESTNRYIRFVQDIALLGMYPYINAAAFWVVKITDFKIIILPLLCGAQIVIGGLLGLAWARIFRFDGKKAGSMFICGALSNLSAFGGLICFVFLGEISYPFVSMYVMFEQLINYSYGFTIAKLYGDKDRQNNKSSGVAMRILRDPYIRTAFLGIIIGIVLNTSGLARPEIFSSINTVIIPLASFLLIVTVGFRMRFSAVKNYMKECLAIGSIKFILIPIVVVSAALLMGMGKIENGLILKVILVMSFMPPAFTALVPPQLYGLDVDLANSTWLFNTAALIIILPLLYAVQVSLF